MSGETRRRGAELEEALLEAAWQELVAVGYGRFTFEGVAARAGTSRPVIYRRWQQRSDLAVAALRHFSRNEVVPVPDTGSFRDDLVTLLHEVSTRRTALIAMFTVQMAEYITETGTTPADLRAQFLEARSEPLGFEVVLRRGIERGEVDPDRLTPRIVALPGDLLRHELLMTLRPASEETIAEIVDQIFMPLVRKQS
jgi:AcrR family transcriptional regulator